jgi:hypothetical protein
MADAVSPGGKQISGPGRELPDDVGVSDDPGANGHQGAERSVAAG